MKIRFIVFCFFLLCLENKGQEQQASGFVSDTMSIPETGKVLNGEYIETTLKNLSVVRLFKTNDNHYYLRLIVTKNFYFDKIDMLEIQSGTKSFYAKGSKQHKISKTRGLFICEVYSNYIVTLKDEGITGIVFGKTETDFSKSDAAQVKKIAATFYERIGGKK